MNCLIQLPNDVISTGYRQVTQYQFEQIFYSPSLNFEGTEKDFLDNGYGYKYIQINNYTRLTC